MVSPAVPTTPTTPRGANSRGRREAVAAWPARAVAVVASRAKPPATTGKLTESNLLVAGIIFSQLKRNIQFVIIMK